MRIWTRKSASIQPRTSYGKSDVSWLCSWLRRPFLRAGGATTHHSFQGSFSAGSTPIFATKASFCSIFRDLQENHLLASKFCKFLPKNFAKSCKIFNIFSKIKMKICKILNFFQKSAKKNVKFCRNL